MVVAVNTRVTKSMSSGVSLCTLHALPPQGHAWTWRACVSQRAPACIGWGMHEWHVSVSQRASCMHARTAPTSMPIYLVPYVTARHGHACMAVLGNSRDPLHAAALTSCPRVAYLRNPAI